MDSAKLTDLVSTMRTLGVTRLRTAEVELELGPRLTGLEGSQLSSESTRRGQVPPPLQETNLEAASPVKSDASKLDEVTRSQIEQLTSLIRMGDSELLDKLFPAKEATQDEVVAAADEAAS